MKKKKILDIVSLQKCNGCSACYSVCPQKCITMEIDAIGFKYPKINESNCIDCNLCDSVCSVLSFKEPKIEPKFYSAYNKNTEIVKSSSSGGLFTPLANEIIKRKGVVFGVGFDDDFNVVHSYEESIDFIDKFKRSKYVQSDINDSYIKVKKFLDDDRWVYFSGTPCQVGGLIYFLRKKYDKLITQDFICHGVPSPYIWNIYKKQKENEYGSKIVSVNFREQKYGWKGYSLCLKFANESIHQTKRRDDDEMLFLFLKDYSLRPSCYQCTYKTIQRLSDITIADYWGADIKDADVEKNGLSLCLIQSKKGEILLDCINDDLNIEAMKNEEIKKAISINRSINTNSNKPYNYTHFYNLLKTNSLVEVYKIFRSEY